MTGQETVEKFCEAYANKTFKDCLDIMSAAGVPDVDVYSPIQAMREGGYVPQTILSRAGLLIDIINRLFHSSHKAAAVATFRVTFRPPSYTAENRGGRVLSALNDS